MKLPIPQTCRRQYRRTALVIWPTSCRYDVSCHTTSGGIGPGALFVFAGSDSC